MSSQASPDLIWSVVKNSSSFLKKSNGFVIASERGNLVNKNVKRFSGLANENALDVRAGTYFPKNKTKESVRGVKRVTVERVSLGKPIKGGRYHGRLNRKRVMQRVAADIQAVAGNNRLKNIALARAVRAFDVSKASRAALASQKKSQAAK